MVGVVDRLEHGRRLDRILAEPDRGLQPAREHQDVLRSIFGVRSTGDLEHSLQPRRKLKAIQRHARLQRRAREDLEHQRGCAEHIRLDARLVW
jgi:hypothetical protein